MILVILHMCYVTANLLAYVANFDLGDPRNGVWLFYIAPRHF